MSNFLGFCQSLTNKPFLMFYLMKLALTLSTFAAQSTFRVNVINCDAIINHSDSFLWESLFLKENIFS